MPKTHFLASIWVRSSVEEEKEGRREGGKEGRREGGKERRREGEKERRREGENEMSKLCCRKIHRY
jgi:hypothetical protein